MKRFLKDEKGQIHLQFVMLSIFMLIGITVYSSVFVNSPLSTATTDTKEDKGPYTGEYIYVDGHKTRMSDLDKQQDPTVEQPEQPTDSTPNEQATDRIFQLVVPVMIVIAIIVALSIIIEPPGGRW